MEYCRAEKINLREYHDEKWLQDRIEEDPSLLGLGDIVVIERERRQPTGGRIDFLLHDPEIQTMYEVEIQLGATDEKHIIRTIEYWDIEKKRFSSKDHKAVIVAEDITSRFFNVIQLMNRSIPVIAIQLNALKVDDKLILNFTKVLDTFQEQEDEEELGGESVDRNYWENRANSKSILLMDNLIGIVQKMHDSLRITYNKHHVAIGTNRRNFAWFHPRKREGYCYFDIKVGEDNIEKARNALEEAGISFTPKWNDDVFGMPLQFAVFENNKEIIEQLFKDACEKFK